MKESLSHLRADSTSEPTSVREDLSQGSFMSNYTFPVVPYATGLGLSKALGKA
jgi:hypothetical protein